MAGAKDEKHYKIISNYTQAASTAGTRGDYATEIRMLRYLIDTLPDQLDVQFCLASAFFSHHESKKAILTYTDSFHNLHDIVLQIECMKHQLTASSNPIEHPSQTFPSKWVQALLPEEMVSSYLGQKMHDACNTIEQTIRGRNDLGLEINLCNQMTDIIESSKHKWSSPSYAACCRVYYMKGETNRKYQKRPDVSEESFMSADGYHCKSKGYHDYVALTAVPDLCFLQVQMEITNMLEKQHTSNEEEEDIKYSMTDMTGIVMTIERGVAVARMMMETVDSTRDAQEYTTVCMTLAKSVWNQISMMDKIHEITTNGLVEGLVIETNEIWKLERVKLMQEALVLAKHAEKECTLGYCKEVPEIDQENLAACKMLVEGLEKE